VIPACALDDPTTQHRGATAASAALAEATWAHARCQAVTDARLALAAGDAPNPNTMREIVVVDAPHCPGA
jgi:hypothetical protein